MKISNQAKQMARDLGLSDIDAAMMDLKATLYHKCANAIKNSRLTHLAIAKLSGTSRARITRLSNHGENSVSLELLIKICGILEERLPVKVASNKCF